MAMKTIEIGKVNDCTLFAFDNGYGRLCPLTDDDLIHVDADYKIKYDSGVYPSVTDVEQYICDQARLYLND